MRDAQKGETVKPMPAVQGCRPALVLLVTPASTAPRLSQPNGSDTPPRIANQSLDHSTAKVPLTAQSCTSWSSPRSRSTAKKCDSAKPSEGTQGPAKKPV